MYKKKIKIGLSLSGGGARGFAHMGALQALLEAGIEPDVLAGASAGSVVGTLYAAGHSPQAMLKFTKDSNFLRFISIGLPNGGLTKLSYLRERLANVIKKDDFGALQRPMYVAVTNLNAGEFELRHTGVLFDTVMASCSIPLVFQPVEIDGNLYVDGGLLCNLPVSPLKDQSDFVIGINLVPRISMDMPSLSGVKSIAYRCFDLSVLSNTQPQVGLCDFLLEPSEITNYSIFQFNKYQDIYDLGYETTKEQIENIVEALENREKRTDRRKNNGSLKSLP